jgi:hypothetical protein
MEQDGRGGRHENDETHFKRLRELRSPPGIKRIKSKIRIKIKSCARCRMRVGRAF